MILPTITKESLELTIQDDPTDPLMIIDERTNYPVIIRVWSPVDIA